MFCICTTDRLHNKTGGTELYLRSGEGKWEGGGTSSWKAEKTRDEPTPYVKKKRKKKGNSIKG